MQQTTQDRLQIARNFCTDPDATVREIVSHMYHWYKTEAAIIDMRRAQRRFNKHAAFLRTDLEVLRFRKQLNDHL